MSVVVLAYKVCTGGSKQLDDATELRTSTLHRPQGEQHKMVDGQDHFRGTQILIKTTIRAFSDLGHCTSPSQMPLCNHFDDSYTLLFSNFFLASPSLETKSELIIWNLRVVIIGCISET